MYQERNKLIRTVSVMIIVATLLTTGVFAAESRASSYIETDSATISAFGNGILEIKFYIKGTGTMTKIGCKSIVVYESTDNSNWTHVASYYDSNYSGLMAQNKIKHSGSFYHQGVAGRYYKATVTVYAGNSSGGSVDYLQTGSVKAK